jgi:hypothetical protein
VQRGRAQAPCGPAGHASAATPEGRRRSRRRSKSRRNFGGWLLCHAPRYASIGIEEFFWRVLGSGGVRPRGSSVAAIRRRGAPSDALMEDCSIGNDSSSRWQSAKIYFEPSHRRGCTGKAARAGGRSDEPGPGLVRGGCGGAAASNLSPPERTAALPQRGGARSRLIQTGAPDALRAPRPRARAAVAHRRSLVDPHLSRIVAASAPAAESHGTSAAPDAWLRRSRTWTH